MSYMQMTSPHPARELHAQSNLLHRKPVLQQPKHQECMIWILLSVLALGLGPLGSNASAQSSDTPGKIVVGTKQAPPFAIKGDDGSWRVISIDLWKSIADELGLEFELRETDLEGLLAGLEEGSLDAAVGALTVTADRIERIDFTHPFHTSGLGIAVRADDKGGRWLAFLRGFFSIAFFKVVAALTLVLLAAGLLVWFLERRRNPDQFGGTPVRGLGSGLWWSAVTMTTVGYGDKAPRTAGGRLVAIVWMFACVIMISSFTAAIASSLTVNQLSGRIQGPSDLPGARVATLAGSTSEAYLRRHHITSHVYDTVADGLHAVDQGDVDAVVYDAPILRYLVQRESAIGVIVLPATFERQDYAIGLPQDSRLRKPLNEIMLRKMSDPEWEQMLFDYLGR